MVSISLFYCCKKAFTLIKIWMIGKHSLKHLKKKIFAVIQTRKILLMEITLMQEEFVKILKITNLRKYYELHMQSDTLLLADVF